MNDHVLIRPATPDDASGIARVHVESWRSTYAGIIPADFLAALNVQNRARGWRETITRPDALSSYFVAEVDGQIVGFITGGSNREDDPLYKAELFAIYLLAGEQKRGLGRRLVKALAARLLEQDFKAMLVWVLADNPARGFYERLGGQYLREKTIEIGGAELVEAAYGYPDLHLLV